MFCNCHNPDKPLLVISDQFPAMPKEIKVVGIGIVLICGLYIFTRLSLAFPLAINGLEGPIKKAGT